MATKLKVGNIG